MNEGINNNLDKYQIMSEIKALEQQIYQGGNVDIEKDLIKKIMTDLKEHTITPKEAHLALQKIIDSRQDYH